MGYRLDQQLGTFRLKSSVRKIVDRRYCLSYRQTLYEYIKTRFLKQDKRETEMFTVDFAIKVCPILNKVH